MRISKTGTALCSLYVVFSAACLIGSAFGPLSLGSAFLAIVPLVPQGYVLLKVGLQSWIPDALALGYLLLSPPFLLLLYGVGWALGTLATTIFLGRDEQNPTEPKT